MPRWEGNARERLEKAALELFVERGYAGTTVEDIAAHAGLTQRTFFRYFKDKREVLFYGGEILQKRLTESVRSAEKDVAPLDAVVGAFASVAPHMQARRDLLIPRSALIAAHSELRERELQKASMLTDALAAALRERSVREPAATLAAATGMAVFQVAFERWITAPKPKDLVRHLAAARAELATVIKAR